jgi:hypothetical protein
VAAVGWWGGSGSGVVAQSIWGEFRSSESPMYTRVYPHIADSTNQEKNNFFSCAATMQAIEKAIAIHVHGVLLESINFSSQAARFSRARRRPSMPLSY